MDTAGAGSTRLSASIEVSASVHCNAGPSLNCVYFGEIFLQLFPDLARYDANGCIIGGLVGHRCVKV